MARFVRSEPLSPTTQIPPEVSGASVSKRPKTMSDPSGENDGEPSLQVGPSVKSFELASPAETE